MVRQRSFIVGLIASAYLGAAAACALCWPFGAFIALLAAPIGASLAVFCVAVVLYLAQPGARRRAPGVFIPAPSKAVRAGWIRRSNAGAGGTR